MENPLGNWQICIKSAINHLEDLMESGENLKSLNTKEDARNKNNLEQNSFYGASLLSNIGCILSRKKWLACKSALSS